MLQIQIPSRFAKWTGLAIFHNWFSQEPSLADAFRFAQFYHCQSLRPAIGLRRRPKFTSLIDLTGTEASIIQGFSETTRYKVRRAARENVLFRLVSDIDEYCEFARLDANNLLPYWPFLTVTKAIACDDTLVMHSHLYDKEIGRVALYHSISSYHDAADSLKRNFIGRANRWLHYQDMLYFKSQGALIYDFGGIAKGSENQKMQHINEFKQGFGGDLVEESNYVSYPIIWWNRIVRNQSVST